MTSPPFFSADEICAVVSVNELIAPLKAAMIAVSEDHAYHPPRFAVPLNDAGRMGIMYGGLKRPAIHGAKVLSLFPNAPAKGLSSHQGFVLLFDSYDGRPLASFDAEVVTAMRTAAMSILATQTLARPHPKVITICGAGEQAEWHLRASLTAFPGAAMRIWARRMEAAENLRDIFVESCDRISVFEDIELALCGADVIHTTTAAKSYYLPGALLQPGQHVNLVGASLSDSREIDDAAVARVSMFTDARESSDRESGEIIQAKLAGAIGNDYLITEIGEVLNQTKQGRADSAQITAYKSHGIILQDLAAAFEIFERMKGK